MKVVSYFIYFYFHKVVSNEINNERRLLSNEYYLNTFYQLILGNFYIFV